MKRRTLVLSLVALPVLVQAQVQLYSPVSTAKNGSLTAVAYDWEVIGINPANLGWKENHLLSFTILDAGVSGQSYGINLSTLTQAMHSPDFTTRANDWQKILGTANGMNAYADVNWAAVSFRLPNVRGAFAVNMRDRIFGNGYLGPNAVQAISTSDNQVYNDATVLALLQGTRLQYTHYREINLDYGSKLVTLKGSDDDEEPALARCFTFGGNADGEYALYGGVGIKYIMGLANIDGQVNPDGIDATYALTKNYPNIVPGFPKAPGHGMGFDLGLGASWGKWKFGWSATDLGSVKWQGGYVVNGDTAVASIKYGSDFINELKTGTLAGSKPSEPYTTNLPAKMRVGASYKVNKKILLSTDFVMPLNNSADNLIGPYASLGGEFKMSSFMLADVGVAGTTGYGVAVPLGLSFSIRPNIIFYMGTTDAASYLHLRKDNNVSAAIWVFRYNM